MALLQNPVRPLNTGENSPIFPHGTRRVGQYAAFPAQAASELVSTFVLVSGRLDSNLSLREKSFRMLCSLGLASRGTYNLSKTLEGRLQCLSAMGNSRNNLSVPP